MRTRKHVLAACLVAAINSSALAQAATQASRGELLYTTHCVACHTTQVHWRQKTLAVDWATLNGQVRRWAGNAGLAWTDEDIVEVARYLNANYYRFATPSVTGFGRGDFTRRVALVD